MGRIDSIPSTSLDTIKDWLTSIEIKYYESKVNLNWKNILKSIKEVRRRIKQHLLFVVLEGRANEC